MIYIPIINQFMCISILYIYVDISYDAYIIDTEHNIQSISIDMDGDRTCISSMQCVFYVCIYTDMDMWILIQSTKYVIM